jgi:hypothetical protein
MKKVIISIALLIILAVVAIVLFRSHGSKLTESAGSRLPVIAGFQLSGVAGTKFTGYYIRDGQRVTVSGVLPWSVDTAGVSEFEFRKDDLSQTLTVLVRYGKDGSAKSRYSGEVGAGYTGIRGQVQPGGLSTETFRP